MNLLKISLQFLLVLTFAVSAAAQTDFSDPNVKYTFTLPSDSWKMTVAPSKVSPNVEYVYEYKNNGHLEIRSHAVEENDLFGDVIKQEELRLQFFKGYVAGKEENFAGSLSGRVFNFEFVRAGRNMSGRYYLLRSDDTTIYVLRFEGLKENLRSIRNETDSIARTFKMNTKM